MTIGEAISYLRILIKNFDDDSKYTDQYLYEVLKNAGSIIFYRMISSGKPIPPFFWSTYYVILEKTKDNTCVPEHLQCDVYETPFKIPDVVQARNNIFFQVIYKGRTVPRLKPGLKEHFIFKCRDIFYDIVNGKLRIYSTIPVKGVYVKGIFSDNSQWYDKQCDETSNSVMTPCDIMEMSFPLLSDSSYKDMAFSQALQSLGLSMQFPDTTQNQQINENRTS